MTHYVRALFIMLLPFQPVAVLQAQDDAEQRIARAESLYAAGYLVDLSGLPSTYEATDEQALAVHRLTVLVYLQREAVPEAKVAALRLLHHEPEYVPDPAGDPPAYVALMREVREAVLTAGDPHATCAAELSSARSRYREGDFPDAIQVLSACLNTRLMYLPEEEYRPALRLLSLLYLRTGDVARAKATVQLLLRRAPRYVADPVQDPPGYVAMVDLVRAHAHE